MNQLTSIHDTPIFDVQADAVRARIADLQREARLGRAAVEPTPAHGLRQTLGRTLIRLGSALVSEDAIRSARPATHP